MREDPYRPRVCETSDRIEDYKLGSEQGMASRTQDCIVLYGAAFHS